MILDRSERWKHDGGGSIPLKIESAVMPMVLHIWIVSATISETSPPIKRREMKMKAQMKAIVASVVVIALCLAAVGGVTYSWFSDTEQSDIDISTGKIDLQLNYSEAKVQSYGDDQAKDVVINGSATPTSLGGDVKITTSGNSFAGVMTIDFNNAAPGDTILFKVSGSLTNSIKVTYREECVVSSTSSLPSPFVISGIADTTNSPDPGTPRDKGTYTIDERTISIHMKETAGNEYQDVNFKITIIFSAIQYNSSDNVSQTQVIPTTGTISPITVSNDDAGSIITLNLPASAFENQVTLTATAVSEYSSSDVSYALMNAGTLIGGLDVDIAGAESSSLANGKTATIAMTLDGVYQNITVYHEADAIPKDTPTTEGDLYFTATTDGSTTTVTIFNVTSFSAYYVLESPEAMIGDTKYATLQDAIDQCNNNEMTEVKLILGKEYSIPSNAQNKMISFTGVNGTKITYHEVNNNLKGSTVEFHNLEVCNSTTNTNYYGYAHIVSAVYEDCTISGKHTLYGPSYFYNCTFKNTGDYNIWTWGAKEVVMDNCKLYCDGKSVLLYGGAGSTSEVTTTLTITNSVFNDSTNGASSSNKAAVEIGNDYDATYILNLSNNVINGFQINDTGSYTGTKEWANKNSMDEDHLFVTIDGKAVYGNFDKYEAIENGTMYQKLEDAIQSATNGSTIAIFKGVTISSDKLSISGKNITLDLKGYTITVSSGSTVFSNETEDNVTINIIDGTIVTPTTGINSGIVVESNTTLNLTNVIIDASAGSGILPRGEGAVVNVYDSHVIANVWGISTNASTSPDQATNEKPTTYGVTINIQNSTIETKSDNKDNTAVMLNVGSSNDIGGILMINNSKLISDRICLIVRAGDATVVDTKFIYGGGFNYYNPNKYSGVASDLHWENGNEVTTGVIVVGNLTKNAYKADANLTIKNSEIYSPSGYRTLVVAQDNVNGKNATATIIDSPSVLANVYTINGDDLQPSTVVGDNVIIGVMSGDISQAIIGADGEKNIVNIYAYNADEIYLQLSGDSSLNLSDYYQTIGGPNTTAVHIIGKNVYEEQKTKLSLNTSYRLPIHSEATLYLDSLEIGNVTHTGTREYTWDAYDIIFKCPVVIQNVVFDQAIALDNAGSKSILCNVTINETNSTTDAYALWVCAGADVSIENSKIIGKSSTGKLNRCIKISDQYIPGGDHAESGAVPATVLNVSSTTFESNKKSAVLVGSAGGATIIWNENNDINGCTANTTNPVTVDNGTPVDKTEQPLQKYQNYNNVTINGEQAPVET